LSEVARRFQVDVGTVKKRLADYGLETADLEKLGFEAKYAQMDIQVAPEGVSRRALAQTMWVDIEPHLPEPPPEPEPVVEEAAPETDGGDSAEPIEVDSAEKPEELTADGEPEAETSTSSDEAETSASSDVESGLEESVAVDEPVADVVH